MDLVEIGPFRPDNISSTKELNVVKKSDSLVGKRNQKTGGKRGWDREVVVIVVGAFAEVRFANLPLSMDPTAGKSSTRLRSPPFCTMGKLTSRCGRI